MAAALAAVLASAFAAALWLRVPTRNAGIPQSLAALRHDATDWVVAPSYPHDALAFLNLVARDPFFMEFYPDDPAGPWRDRMTPAERRSAGRLKSWIRDRFGSTLSSVLTYFYQASGAVDLDGFRNLLRDPDALMAARRRELDAWSAAALGGWRLPPFLFRVLARDLGAYLDFLERTDFESWWIATRLPSLEEAARGFRSGLAGYNLVPAVESALGGGLPSARVTVLLGAFLRPNGISMGRNVFLVEDRPALASLVGVAAHELIHGYADWNAPALAKLRGVLSRDPLASRRFAARDAGMGYNNWTAIAEESWTKALDQIVKERIFPLAAPDPRERWWFQDGGLHPSALLFYRELRSGGPAPGQAASAWLAEAVEGGRFPEACVSALWDREFGGNRPGALPPEPPIGRIHLSGDPALAALHPSYAEVMDPGMAVVFLKDWFTFEGGPAASLAILDAAGRAMSGTELVDPVTGLRYRGRYRFAGNWSTQADGRTWYYKNSLYFSQD